MLPLQAQVSDAPDTLAALLHQGRCFSPDGSALVREDGFALSHDSLHGLLERSETDLRALGVTRKSRVMSVLPDGALAACVLLALTRSAVCMPVNPDLRGTELELLLPELLPDVLVTHGDCADEARRVAKGRGIPIVEVDWAGDTGLKWLGEALPPHEAQNDAAVPDDVALILLTSGSSARPKRVPLTHRQLTLSAQRMAGSLALVSTDVCLNMMPMFHVGAVVDLLLAPLSVGGAVVRPESMSAAAFFESLERFRPSWYQGVPTMLHEIAAQAERRLGGAQRTSLRLVRSVSSPLPAEWLAQVERALRAPVIEIYGMTETAGVITSNPLPPRVQKIGSVGLVTGLELTIRNEEGAEVMAGQRGEILVRGAGVMTGYERHDGAATGLSDDGWLSTGDEGYMDDDGYLFITGRIADQINRGGEKVSPREVDEVLLQHKAVQEAAVFPLPHALLGQEVAAAVVLKPGEVVQAGELSAHVSAQLAHFKVPKTFYVLAELPRGPGGKLRRRLLPEMVLKLAPLVDESAAAVDLPQSEMEKQVALWWQKELQVEQITRGDDFFELGGDSLAAVGFTVSVEKALGIRVRPAALFDHPTLAAFAGYLETAVAGKASQAAADATVTPLKPEFLRQVQAAMSIWPGSREMASPLFIGLRTSGADTPIFWCGQGRNEFEGTAIHWPDQHPFYGTRSLFLFEGKTKQDEGDLAELFAIEVERLRAGREVIIGGFCAGGRIAFDAACRLRQRGVPIKLVFMHEAWATKRIDVPVALSFCTDSGFSPWRKFSRPEVAMNKRFTGGWKCWSLQTSHIGVFQNDLMKGEVQKLRTLMADPAQWQRSGAMHELPPQAYRAKLSARTPWWVRKGRSFQLKIVVTNESQQDWPATSESGIYLAHRWLDAEGKPSSDPGSSVPLPHALPSKAKVTVLVTIQAPLQGGKHTLELDMVDEGLKWFSEKRGTRKPSYSTYVSVRCLDI
jgi:oxalate---CoA ligase